MIQNQINSNINLTITVSENVMQRLPTKVSILVFACCSSTLLPFTISWGWIVHDNISVSNPTCQCQVFYQHLTVGLLHKHTCTEYHMVHVLWYSVHVCFSDSVCDSCDRAISKPSCLLVEGSLVLAVGLAVSFLLTLPWGARPTTSVVRCCVSCFHLRICQRVFSPLSSKLSMTALYHDKDVRVLQKQQKPFHAEAMVLVTHEVNIALLSMILWSLCDSLQILQTWCMVIQSYSCLQGERT